MSGKTVKFCLYSAVGRAGSIYTKRYTDVLLNLIPVSSEIGCANLNTATFRSPESVASALALSFGSSGYGYANLNSTIFRCQRVVAIALTSSDTSDTSDQPACPPRTQALPLWLSPSTASSPPGLLGASTHNSFQLASIAFGSEGSRPDTP